LTDPNIKTEGVKTQGQAAAEAWHCRGPTVEVWLGEATEVMLDMAGVDPGSWVLDVAARAGGQTILAARRVGPDGLDCPARDGGIHRVGNPSAKTRISVHLYGLGIGEVDGRDYDPSRNYVCDRFDA
jgi:hypothetical protein